MSLETDVAGVLRKDPVGRIAFSLEHVAVNKTQMELVAKAIDNGDVAVSLGSAGNYDAAYSSFTDRRPESGQKKLIGEIRIRRTSVLRSPIGRAGIFHESVHALLDVKPQNLSRRHGDEVLAYIADSMYLKAAHTPISGDPPTMAIYDAAFAIITKHNMLTKHGIALKWDDCSDLLSAIDAHPDYP
jgi:hypothetical protein